MAESAPQSAPGAKGTESMEDILQSIKRIIEDDTGAKPEQAAAPDILDLTQVIKEDGSVAPLGPLPKAVSAAPAPVTEDVVQSIDAMFATPAPTSAPIAPVAAAQLPPEPPPVAPAAPPAAPVTIIAKPIKMEDGLVSDEAAQAAAAALKPILDSAHKDYTIPHIPSSSLRNGNTVEELILEALRPMLKAWLDEHLPTIVQKIVEKEVKRIVTFHQD
jgi:cell pole-organizing protein PopZ